MLYFFIILRRISAASEGKKGWYFPPRGNNEVINYRSANKNICRRKQRVGGLTREKFPAFPLSIRFQGVKHRGANEEIRKRAHHQRQCPDVLPLHLRRFVPPREYRAHVSALQNKKFNSRAFNEFPEISLDGNVPRDTRHLYGSTSRAHVARINIYLAPDK